MGNSLNFGLKFLALLGAQNGDYKMGRKSKRDIEVLDLWYTR